MHRWKFIFIAFLAILTASFTIELPFTQVNYIHQLAGKKNSCIKAIPGDTQRLHKTYYESPGDMLQLTFVRIAIPGMATAPHIATPVRSYPPSGSTGHPNILRGPPSIA